MRSAGATVLPSTPAMHPRGWISVEIIVQAVGLMQYFNLEPAMFIPSISVGVATQVNNSDYWICGSLTRLVSSLPDPMLLTSTRTRGTQSTSSASSAYVASGSNKKMMGPLIGGVLGGILVLSLIFLTWRCRRRMRRRQPVGFDVGISTRTSSEPAPLLHRRELSEQSQAMSQLSRTTTDLENPVSPLLIIGHETRSMEIPSLPHVARSERRYQHSDMGQHADTASPVSPPILRGLDLAHDSHTTIHTRFDRSVSGHDPTSPVSPTTTLDISSQVAIPSESPATAPQVFREKSQYYPSSSIARVRRPPTPPPPLPNPMPVSTEDLEQGLRDLRDEAERRLAAMRAQRVLSSEVQEGGEMPPPYHR
jgi:hypothetical protein